MTATPAAAADREQTGALAAFKERLKRFAHGVLGPVVSGLARLGLTADHVTWLGLILGVAAGAAFFEGNSQLAAALLLAGGLCDILDGELARRRGVSSRFGAFLDSTLDRFAEAAALVGIAGFGLRNLEALAAVPGLAAGEIQIELYPMTWMVLVLLAVLSLVGSFMVSYTRARAEGLGIECRVGWLERPERIVILILAGALHVFWAMSGALLILTVLSFVTAGQRVVHVWKQTRRAGRD